MFAMAYEIFKLVKKLPKRIDSYTKLTDLWVLSLQATTDTEMKASLELVQAVMSTFQFLISYFFGKMILTHFCLVFPFYNPLKNPENHRFSNVFRGYKKETPDSNRLP